MRQESKNFVSPRARMDKWDELALLDKEARGDGFGNFGKHSPRFSGRSFKTRRPIATRDFT